MGTIAAVTTEIQWANDDGKSPIQRITLRLRRSMIALALFQTVCRLWRFNRVI